MDRRSLCGETHWHSVLKVVGRTDQLDNHGFRNSRARKT